jgi:hypothetical protein
MSERRYTDEEVATIFERAAGLPIGVGRTVELDRPRSDSDWERLVADLRETFEARGMVRYDGPFRQWTNGNLQALIEPTPSGHRLRWKPGIVGVPCERQYCLQAHLLYWSQRAQLKRQ